MKILLVVRWPSGGIRTYLRYVFRHPVFSGHQFAIVAPDGESLGFLEQEFASGKIRIFDSAPESHRFAARIAWVIRRWKPDLVHSHGYISGVLVAPLARVSRTAHLLTPHDMLFDQQFTGWKGVLKRRAVSLALRSVDHVMAVSEDARENLTAFLPALQRSRRCSVVRNGIDVQTFLDRSRRDLRAELGVGKDTVLLGFFGRFMRPKGFGVLVDGLDISRRRGLDVQAACFGWGGFIREEQEELRHRGLEDWFHFLPHTEEMAPALRGVDAVAMPSRWETCPLLPMEALVAGAPVIASDCIGMREVVRDTPALVFPSEDVDALSRRIMEFADRREELRSTAEEFREEAARRFDSANAAQGLADLYRRLEHGAGRG